MGHTHQSLKKVQLSKNKKRKWKTRKWRSKMMGKVSLSKHRMMGGTGGHNHSISIARTREFNLEEERYKKIREKRKGPMYDNVIQLFRMCKHY